jgi:hypothetical protein
MLSCKLLSNAAAFVLNIYPSMLCGRGRMQMLHPNAYFFAHFQTIIPCLTSGRITIIWFRNSDNSVAWFKVVFADFNTNRRQLGWCKRFTWLVLGSLAARKPGEILGRLLKQSPITEYKHAPHNMLGLYITIYKLPCFFVKKRVYLSTESVSHKRKHFFWFMRSCKKRMVFVNLL